MENIVSDHPICKANWIWPEGYLYLYNHFANFRKDFVIDKSFSKATLYITADQAYRLYINGEYITRGPARGYQDHWPFDELDVSAYLKEGKNWISVEAYNPGISTFSYIHQTSAGFICCLSLDDEIEIVTDDSWKMRRSSGHETQTARLSLQLGFQEHAHTDKICRSWITSPEDPEWEEETAFELTYRRVFPFGQSPYYSLESREIPLLREELVAPDSVKGDVTGKCMDGYRNWQNVSWKFQEEADAVTWNDGKNISCTKDGSSMEITIPASGEGSFSAVLLDMGKCLVGTLLVETDKAADGSILDFNFTEGMEDNRLRVPVTSGSRVSMGNRLYMESMPVKHEFFSPIGFKYLTVTARDLKEDLKVKLSLRTVGYPFEMRGEFKCSDETLNAIFDISRHTQQICSLDAYVDTPWREQAQWWGDARVQGKNTFYIDGDARLLKRGIRSLAGQRAIGGLTFGHAPTSAHSCILPDFSLTWILTIWDFYWQTGDLSLFKEQWSRVQEILVYYDRDEVRHPSGLIAYDRRLWYFGDWADIFRAGAPSFLNQWYYLTLTKLAEMLKLSGMDKEYADISEKAATHKKLIEDLLYDPEQQLVISGLNDDGSQNKGASVHDQVLAMLAGLFPEAHQAMLDKKALPYIRHEKVDGAVPSAFWSTYLFELLMKKGYGKEVIDFIRTKWSNMLSTGSTWEDYKWHPGSGESCSHAWTAHPIYHFVNILAGIDQTAPEWSGIKLEPFFIDGIDNAKAMIPSPKGDISASWERTDDGIAVSLSLPAGVKAEICLPGTSETVTGPGTFEFKEQA